MNGRIDRWDAPLTEVQRWEAYETALRFPYAAFAAWAVKKFALEKAPSCSSFHAWKNAMRKDEGTHRVQTLIQTRLELANLSAVKAAPADMADALVSLGSEAALSGDLDAAKKLVEMAASISDGQIKARKLQIQEQELKLSREKFEAAERRNADTKAVTEDETLSEAEKLLKIKTIMGLA